MPRKPRPLAPDIDEALQSYACAALGRRVGVGSHTPPGVRVAKMFAGFLTPNPTASLTLQPLVDARSSDVDRFLDTVKPETAKSYRSALRQFYRHLVSTKVAELNPVDGTLPRHAEARPAEKEITTVEWSELIDAVSRREDGRLPFIRARNLAVLEICRCVQVPPIGLRLLTAGMGRSGEIAIARGEGDQDEICTLDVAARRAVGRYLDCLPIRLDNSDALFRNANLAPADMFVVAAQLRSVAKVAGIEFSFRRFRRIAKVAEMDMAQLVDSFHRLHPRSLPA